MQGELYQETVQWVPHVMQPDVIEELPHPCEQF